MPKKGKKKPQATGDDPDIDILPKMKIIYEDTKSITGVEPEFKWGEFIKDNPYTTKNYTKMSMFSSHFRRSVRWISSSN